MQLATIISILFSFFLVFVLKKDSKMAFIVSGQGHFFLAYLYMYKAGKINRDFMLRYLAFFVLIGGIYWLSDSYILLRFVTATYFLIHFSLDVYHLNRVKISLKKGLLIAFPLIYIYTCLIIKDLKLDALVQVLVMIYPLTLSVYLVDRKEYLPYKGIFFMFSVLLFLSIVFGVNAFVFRYMAIIIFAHNLMWYAYYFTRKSSPAFMRSYVVNVLIVNVLVLLLYYVYRADERFVPGQFLFREDAFYIWTLMHYVATYRKHDFIPQTA